MARAWRRWHHLGGRVRPVLGDACLVGKGRRPAAAVRWDSTQSHAGSASEVAAVNGCDLRIPFAECDRSCPPRTSGFRCRADPARTNLQTTSSVGQRSRVAGRPVLLAEGSD
jgi:hypothetical protein